MPEDIFAQHKPNANGRSPLFCEPVQVIATMHAGNTISLVSTRLNTSKTYQPVLFANQLTTLGLAPEVMPLDYEARTFDLGVEALRLDLSFY